MNAQDTRSDDYSARLTAIGARRWKQHVPNPYRWWLRRQRPGFVLDVGCGVGRSLGFVDGRGVGIDHNERSVERCREQGFTAYTPEEFARSEHAAPGRFDSLLCSHVLEHLEPSVAEDLLRTYLPYVRAGGRVLLITPQERGYASDASHVEFVDTGRLRTYAERLGLEGVRTRSFPLPRVMGRLFIYNEFIATASVPSPTP